MDYDSKEIEEAKKAGKPFNFTHFLLISKLHETKKDNQKKKKVKGENLLFVNAEEEPISEVHPDMINLTLNCQVRTLVSI